MRDEATGQSLQNEEERRYEQKPYYGSLGRRHGHVIDGTKLDRFRFLSAPAKPVVAAKKIQDEPCSSQQANDGDHTPSDGIGSNGITCQRLRRPVVGIRIGVSGTIGRGGPGSPCKERGEFTN